MPRSRRAPAAFSGSSTSRAAFPGIEDRLAAHDEAWAREFLKAAELAATRPDLGADDIDPLAGPALTHAGDEDRLRVIDSIAQWSLVSAAPALLEALDDSSRLGGKEAAEALCLAGLEEGVATLLKETRDRRNGHVFQGYTVSDTRTCRTLNLLRQPESWRKLAATRSPAMALGTRREHVERLAQEVGLKVEWPEGPPDAWLSGRAAAELFEPPVTVLDGLIHLLQGSKIQHAPPRFEIVLEADRLRVLPYLDALRFWEAWRRSR